MRRKSLFTEGALAVVVISAAIGITSAQTTWSQAVGIGGAVDLAREPGSANIFAVVQGSNPGIYRSTDGGQSFNLLKSFTNPYKLAVGVGARLWAATSQGLYKTSNLTTWTKVTGGLPNNKPVTFVGRAGQGSGIRLYATVSSGTARGLYRSLDHGVTWSRVIANAFTQSVTALDLCGTEHAQTVFAGGILSPGGPNCTLLKSTDNGSSFECTSFPHIVREIVAMCIGGFPPAYDLYVTSPEGAPTQSVRRSLDGGSTFLNDGTGLIDVGAANTIDWVDDVPGRTVGTNYSGIFERGSNPPVGSGWTQFSTEGLLDQRINDWAKDPVAGHYVVATPTGVFAFVDSECPSPGDPNEPCQ